MLVKEESTKREIKIGILVCMGQSLQEHQNIHIKTK